MNWTDRVLDWSVIIVTSAVFLLTFLLSCAPQYEVEVELPERVREDVWGCHADSNWTESRVFDHLIGEWQYDYVNCESGTDGFQQKGEDYSVRFNTDSTLEVREEGSTTLITSWILQDESNGRYSLSTDLGIPEIKGEIAFCEGWAGFHQREEGLCDKYFRKLD